MQSSSAKDYDNIFFPSLHQQHIHCGHLIFGGQTQEFYLILFAA